MNLKYSVLCISREKIQDAQPGTDPTANQGRKASPTYLKFSKWCK